MSSIEDKVKRKLAHPAYAEAMAEGGTKDKLVRKSLHPSRSASDDEPMLMNPHTGTVQSADDWANDGYTTANAELIEVKANDDGDWVEV